MLAKRCVYHHYWHGHLFSIVHEPCTFHGHAFILKHHVTPGKYDKEFLKKFKTLGQASNENVIVEVKGEDVFIGGAKIIASVPAGNGIVHVVDAVILPNN